jgi:hypothetical protein
MADNDRDRFAEAREYLLTRVRPGRALPSGHPPAPPLGAPDARGADNLARAATMPLDELAVRYLPPARRVIPELDEDAYDPGG